MTDGMSFYLIIRVGTWGQEGEPICPRLLTKGSYGSHQTLVIEFSGVAAFTANWHGFSVIGV